MQQDVSNCCEVVCVGEWWAATLVFIVVDGGVFFFIAVSKEVSKFWRRQCLEFEFARVNIHSC